MKTLADVYQEIRQAVVAFVPRFPAHHELAWAECPHLQWVFGTGFVVGDSLIATNRHVAEQFTEQPRGPDAVKFPACAALFCRLPQGLAIGLLNVCNVAVVSGLNLTSGFSYHTELPDLAILSVECTGLQRFSVKLSDDAAPVGTEIATAGFSNGSWLLAPNAIPERFGPVLQRGIVSGESPFEGTEPHSILIDVMVQGGASGSPVFRADNGDVIGVVNARHLDFREVTINGQTVSIEQPTSFSHVVPVHFLRKLLSKSQDTLQASVPSTAPTIDKLLRQIPVAPSDRITNGRYTTG